MNSAVFDLATTVFINMKLLVTALFSKSTAMLHRFTTCSERLVDIKGMHYALMHSVFALCFIILTSGSRSAGASTTSTIKQTTTLSQPAHNEHEPSSQHHTFIKPMLAAGFASSVSAAAFFVLRGRTGGKTSPAQQQPPSLLSQHHLALSTIPKSAAAAAAAAAPPHDSTAVAAADAATGAPANASAAAAVADSPLTHERHSAAAAAVAKSQPAAAPSAAAAAAADSKEAVAVAVSVEAAPARPAGAGVGEPGDLDEWTQRYLKVKHGLKPTTVAEAEACARVREGLGGLRAEERERLPEGWLQELWATDLLRFVRANRRDHDAALAQLLESGAWRKEFGADAVIRDPAYSVRGFFNQQEPEVEWTPPQTTRNPGQPLLIYRSALHQPKGRESDAWVRFFVHQCEFARAAFPDHQVAVIIDRIGSGLSNQDPSVLKALVPVITRHYPQIVSRVYIAPVDTILFVIWSLVSLIMDEESRSRIRLIKGEDWKDQLAKYLDPGALPVRLGGLGGQRT